LKISGFFRREKKEELKRKIRESRIVSLKEIEKVLAEMKSNFGETERDESS
jgi:hypothetical protein